MRGQTYRRLQVTELIFQHQARQLPRRIGQQLIHHQVRDQILQSPLRFAQLRQVEFLLPAEPAFQVPHPQLKFVIQHYLPQLMIQLLNSTLGIPGIDQPICGQSTHTRCTYMMRELLWP
jgi:hypothetical protein